MIIIHLKGVNGISQEIYDKMLEQIDYLLLVCPHCHHTGTTVHAYYDRGVKYNGKYFRLIVLRVICSFCGKTHAILPDTIVPYSLVTLADTIGIVLAESPQEVDKMLASNICLDLSDVYRIKTKFKMFWKERLSSFEINIDQSISRNCIRMFARQFMQIRCTLCGDYG